MKVNVEWHSQNVMLERASLDQRVAWHVGHAETCGCRAIPETVKQELERKGRRAAAVSSAA